MIAEETTEQIEEQNNKIPVGISSCLLGEKVRYDGGHKNNSYVGKTLGQYFDLQAFCPKLDIGLGIPRSRFAFHWETRILFAATLPTVPSQTSLMR